MKKLNLKAILLFVSVAILASCSSDDNDNEDVIITGDYFPSAESNFWKYDVTDTDPKSTSDDFLSVKSSASNSFNVEANNGTGANGYMNSILSSGTLTRGASNLVLNGNLEVPIDGIEDLQISLSNTILYDLNADNGEILKSITSSSTKQLEGQDLTLTYTLNFNKVKDHSSYKVNGEPYTTVTESIISLNLSISTVIDGTTLYVLDDAQGVLTIDSFFAENVGLIKSVSKLNYNLNSDTLTILKTLKGIDISVESKSNTNTQELTEYNN